jgi:hypothetical protein
MPPGSIPERYSRVELILQTLARQQGWAYKEGVAQVTAHLTIHLEKSGSASATGIIIRVGGDPVRMARKFQRSWRRLSGTNNKADARTMLELAHTLAAKERMLQAELDQEKTEIKILDRQRAAVAAVARDFQARTGRTVATLAWGPAEATNITYQVPFELQEREAREAYVKRIRITPEGTELEIQVPNERAAEIYNLIEAAKTSS